MRLFIKPRALGAIAIAVIASALTLRGQTSETTSILVGSYASLGRALPWGSVGPKGTNNNFLLQLPKPEGYLCIAVANNNPTSSHTFSFAAFGSSNPNQTTFVSSPSTLWSTLTVNGTFNSVSASSVAAASVPIAGLAVVNLQFSSTSAGSGTPDTADIFASQTTSAGCSAISAGSSASTGQAIQGPVADAVTPTLPFPVLVGLQIPGTSTIQSFTSPNGRNGTVGVGFLPKLFSDTSDTVNSGTSTKTLFTGESSTFLACDIWLNATNNAGSTPTLNVYVQVSGDGGSNWDDRVSFVQATTGTTHQEVMINSLPSAGTGPAATTDASLAAGSARNGILTGQIRAKYVVGGTSSPAYTLSLFGACQ